MAVAQKNCSIPHVFGLKPALQHLYFYLWNYDATRAWKFVM